MLLPVVFLKKNWISNGRTLHLKEWYGRRPKQFHKQLMIFLSWLLSLDEGGHRAHSRDVMLSFINPQWNPTDIPYWSHGLGLEMKHRLWSKWGTNLHGPCLDLGIFVCIRQRWNEYLQMLQIQCIPQFWHSSYWMRDVKQELNFHFESEHFGLNVFDFLASVDSSEAGRLQIWNFISCQKLIIIACSLSNTIRF